VSAPSQARLIILFELMAITLILGVTHRLEQRSTDDRVTVLRCKTISSHDFQLLDKQGNYERPRGTFRKSLNECRLFLVVLDQVYCQPALRVDRNQDDRVETRIPAPE
jgi:hypothetical protein